ncbi:MAG: hypothetical protein Q7J66_15550, partial [Hydrogenophaga sp.]|nr:hypothetical protein [Hydrogenophaga sp.]
CSFAASQSGFLTLGRRATNSLQGSADCAAAAVQHSARATNNLCAGFVRRMGMKGIDWKFTCRH